MAYKFGRSMGVEDIEEELKKLTIFDYIEHTGLSKEEVATMLRNADESARNRREDLLPHIPDAELGFYWFKNNLHPRLKHMVAPAPADKRGCSKEVIRLDMKRDMLNFYELGQQNFDYTREDIEKWINQD